jgi:hypothetical protein
MKSSSQTLKKSGRWKKWCGADNSTRPLRHNRININQQRKKVQRWNEYRNRNTEAKNGY